MSFSAHPGLLHYVGFSESTPLWRTVYRARRNALRFAQQMSDDDADRLADTMVVVVCVLVGCGWPTVNVACS